MGAGGHVVASLAGHLGMGLVESRPCRGITPAQLVVVRGKNLVSAGIIWHMSWIAGAKTL